MIQEDIYSELYPKLKRQPNELKTVLLRKLSSLKHLFKFKRYHLTADTNYCDYDADEEDEEWLKHHLRISLNQFEKVIEWLELNSKKFVPLLNDLKKSKVTKGLHKNDKEAIFDYWIDKRITSKKRMIPIVKIDNSTTITSASNVDPYKVFRKPQEMICNTRHRRRPHFNLKIHAEKALKEVTDLKHKLNILRDLKDKEYHRHMKLKEGFANFIMEYRHERYSQDEISYFKSLNKENQVETLSNSSGFENIDNDYDEDYGPYSFERKFCNLKYYKPKEF